jgi:hypothetical protein
MKVVRAILGTSLWFMLAGCQTVSADYDQPARIVNPDAASRAALQAAVNEALGTEVMLADDALTGGSWLTIENWPAGTMDNPVPQGRILEKPIRFQLVRSGEECVLVRSSDGARYRLADTECRAE